jgi:hypothetical protein
VGGTPYQWSAARVVQVHTQAYVAVTDLCGLLTACIGTGNLGISYAACACEAAAVQQAEQGGRPSVGSGHSQVGSVRIDCPTLLLSRVQQAEQGGRPSVGVGHIRVGGIRVDCPTLLLSRVQQAEQENKLLIGCGHSQIGGEWI